MDDEVEEFVWIGKAGWIAGLEGDPSFWVEAESAHSRADALLRWVKSAHPGRGELPGEEEHTVAISAADLEYALGPAAHLQDSRRECEEGRWRHPPIIATCNRAMFRSSQSPTP